MQFRQQALGAGWSAPEITRAVVPEGQQMPRIDFVVEAKRCPDCGGLLGVQKSRRRTLTTLSLGTFEAREILKHCASCRCPVMTSDALRRLARPGQRFGYDVMVCVGLSRYLAGRQRKEIQQLLSEQHGIELSTGTISALCDRFLSYLECLHVSRAPALRKAMADYPLHVDATSEGRKGGLFICLNGWRQWVLVAARISSESADELSPLVEQTRARFGDPIAVVRDMGEGMAGAVAGLRQAGIPDLICHYHFVAAAGRKLLGSLNAHLRGLIRLSNLRPDLGRLLRDLKQYSDHQQTEGRFGSGRVRENLKALVLWLLHGDGKADPPFPFALTHFDFVRRCNQAARQAERWVPRPRTVPERRALRHLDGLVARLEREERVAPTVSEVEKRWTAFSELRSVLRLSNADLPRGDTRYSQRALPAFEVLRLEEIKEAVQEYQSALQERVPATDRNPAKPVSTPGIILRYLRRYGDQLFGHPARVDDQGRILAVVDRTNNVAEHFFGHEKQRLRRRVGRAQLGRDLDKQPAQAALAANLRSPEYVRIVCGSLQNLPQTFAALDRDPSLEIAQSISRDLPSNQLHRRVRALLDGTKQSPLPPPETETPGQTEQPAPSNPPVLSENGGDRPTIGGDESPAEPDALSPPQPDTQDGQCPLDPRLPPAGTTIERWHRRRAHRVRVLNDGFQYGQTHYASLTAVAKAITGRLRNGFRFFGLTRPWTERQPKLRGRRISRTTLVDLPAATEF